MPLKLNIVSYQRLTPGQNASFSADTGRVCIGRNQDNDWTLPDPQRFMSGTHCWVEERSGAWHLTDTSTNGTFINGSEDRVEKNQSVRLQHGDRIRLGDYELEVAVDEVTESGVGHPADLHDDEEDIFAQPRPQEAVRSGSREAEANVPLSQLDQDMLGGGVSIDDLYGLSDEDDPSEAPPKLASIEGRTSPLEDHFSPPRVESKDRDEAPRESRAKTAAASNDWADWDSDTGQVETETESDEPAPQPKVPAAGPTQHAAPPAPTAEERQAPVAGPSSGNPEAPVAPPPAASPGKARRDPGSRAALEAFAHGCGLEADTLRAKDEAELFELAGALLRAMTEGVLQAIASRGQVKSEFRLEQTMIAPTRNNPFKFSASPQEALLRLLGPADGAYLAGPAAATEALDDINAHQLAVLAGTEAALKSLLRRFSPSALETRFGGDSTLGKAVPMIRKARFWDYFKLLYDEISEATDDDFQKFFGSEFSRAYEKQLERLVTSRTESKK